jgi:hypothetical protein
VRPPDRLGRLRRRERARRDRQIIHRQRLLVLLLGRHALHDLDGDTFLQLDEGHALAELDLERLAEEKEVDPGESCEDAAFVGHGVGSVAVRGRQDSDETTRSVRCATPWA